MTTEPESPTTPGRKNRLAIVALLFAFVWPVAILLKYNVQIELDEAPAIYENILSWLWICSFLCPLVAFFCGCVAREKNKKKRLLATCGRTLGGMQLVIQVVVFVWFVISSASSNDVFPHTEKSKDNLKQLYILCTMYANSGNQYPSLQLTNVFPRRSGGVRDLFPLYQIQNDKRKFLELLRPRPLMLPPFPLNPSTDDFNGAHIGYCYNSTAIPMQYSPVALMCEQGVSNGVLLVHERKRTVRPPFKDGIHVLFSNGDVTWLHADSDGHLNTNNAPPIDWSLLVK